LYWTALKTVYTIVTIDMRFEELTPYYG